MRNCIWLLAGLIICSSTNAQNPIIETKSSHTVVTVSMEELGKINLVLPRNILANEIFSPGIKITPDGKKEKDIEKNRQELSNSNIQLGTNNFNVLQPSTITLTADEIKNLPLKIKNASGKTMFESQLNGLFNSPLIRPGTFSIPTHAVTGSRFSVSGPFDGNSSTTKCTIGGKPVPVLAESHTQCIIEFPLEIKGPTTIKIEENGITVTENIGGVDYTLSAGRLNLLRGESTHIDVSITGLQNLKENATLAVDNLTTDVVIMTGGNNQVYSILPAEISGMGEFNKRFILQSIKTGTFSVNVNLVLPEPGQSMAIPTLNNWIACPACSGVMMPMATCIKMTELISKTPVQQLKQQPDTSCACFTFEPVISKEGNVLLQLNPVLNNDLAMVVYSAGNFAGKEKQVLGYDNFRNNPVSFSTSSLSSGANKITATAYHGNNYTSTVQKNMVVIPHFNSSISNPQINQYRKRIQQIKDSIENLQRIIDNGNRRIYENYPSKRRLDSIELVRQGYYNQLVHIDAVLETIPKLYADTLTKLLDSLDRFKKKVPEAPDEEALKKRVAELEEALKACQEHVKALEQEQKDLQNELKDVEQQQSGELKKILDCFDAAGYDYVGHTTRSKNGEFGYGFDAVKNGQALNGIPAQCLKTVSESKKKIEELKQRHREIRNRLRDLPGEISQGKADCDRLSKELQLAKESLRKGRNALIEYGFINSDLDDICRQIRGILDELIRFCKNNPQVCNAEQQVETLMANCPQSNFWKGFDELINYKKSVEDNMKKQAEDAKRQLDQNRAEEVKIYGEIDRATQQQAAKAAGLPGLLAQEDAATQAELEKQLLQQDSARAMRRRICEEFLKTQATTKEEKDAVDLLLGLKENIQGFGENVKKASEYGDMLTKERYKEITDSLRNIIDRLLEPLGDYDKLKKEYDKWKEIKEDLEKVFSGDDSPKANAEKLKIILKRIKEQLDNLTEKFPILELFVNYFGYLVDGYSWAVDQSFKNAETFFRINLESKLNARVNCQWLMNEYMKRKNVDDVVRKAKERINWEGEIDPLLGGAGNRDAAEGEMKKLILKMLADCCLSYIMI